VNNVTGVILFAQEVTADKFCWRLLVG